MAYPMEQEYAEYQDYRIELESRGETPLSKDEWRKKIKNAKKSDSIPTALSEY